jgi:hypothetical protein
MQFSIQISNERQNVLTPMFIEISLYKIHLLLNTQGKGKHSYHLSTFVIL